MPKELKLKLRQCQRKEVITIRITFMRYQSFYGQRFYHAMFLTELKCMQDFILNVKRVFSGAGCPIPNH